MPEKLETRIGLRQVTVDWTRSRRVIELKLEGRKRFVVSCDTAKLQSASAIASCIALIGLLEATPGGWAKKWALVEHTTSIEIAVRCWYDDASSVICIEPLPNPNQRIKVTDQAGKPGLRNGPLFDALYDLLDRYGALPVAAYA